MREVSLDRLKTLIFIAEYGSFSAAAKLLNLAPATVSLHIAELEARVGAPLLLRTRGQVRPSTIGTLLVERAQRVLDDVGSVMDDVRRQVLGEAGRVRLGASTGAFAHLLPEALTQLQRHYPEIDIQIQVLTSRETLSRLVDGQLDIGIVALPQSDARGVTIVPWRRDPILAFMPAAWNPPARVTPAWLASRPLILNDASTHLFRLTTDWFAANRLRPTARVELNYNEAAKSLVAAGYGAALLPHEAGAPQPEPRVAMRPLRPGLWRELGLACRTGETLRTVERVLGVLRDLRVR